MANVLVGGLDKLQVGSHGYMWCVSLSPRELELLSELLDGQWL
jgi:hypothetical protein